MRLRYLLSRFPALLNMLLSPLSFFARLVGCPGRLLALNLLPILGNLRCTEAAHLFSYIFFPNSEKWLTPIIARIGEYTQAEAYLQEGLNLAFTGGLHPGAYGFGVLNVALVGQVFGVNAGSFDMDIDAV